MLNQTKCSLLEREKHPRVPISVRAWCCAVLRGSRTEGIPQAPSLFEKPHSTEPPVPLGQHRQTKGIAEEHQELLLGLGSGSTLAGTSEQPQPQHFHPELKNLSVAGPRVCSTSCAQRATSAESPSRPACPALPSTGISALTTLLCFSSVFFLLAEKLLLGLKRHRANHQYERDTLRREQINPHCRENSSFLECLF